MERSEAKEFGDNLVYRVVELLFEKRGEGNERLKMEAIAAQVNEDFGLAHKPTRESLNPLAEEAVRRGFMKLTPPVSQALVTSW